MAKENQLQKKKKKPSRPSTQLHLLMAEIKDGVVVLKDGTLRKILMTSSINFALKSEDEQNALIAAYVGFFFRWIFQSKFRCSRAVSRLSHILTH